MNTANKIYGQVKVLLEVLLELAELLEKRTNANRSPKKKTLAAYAGILKDSPNFNEDPVEIQRTMRSEWD